MQSSMVLTERYSNINHLVVGVDSDKVNDRVRKSTTTTTTTGSSIENSTKKTTSKRKGRLRQQLPFLFFLCCTFSIIGIYYSKNFNNFVHINGEIIPSSQQCNKSHNYNGILHISQGDSQGAAGTIFFLFVINQLIYADMYNLLPWIHLSNVSQYVYDPIIHGLGSGQEIKFDVLDGWIVPNQAYIDPISNQRVVFPGPPVYNANKQHNSSSPLLLQKHIERITGNGVWESYFESVSNYKPGSKDRCISNLPFIRLSPSQLISLHIHWPYSVRAWRYGGMPPSLIKEGLSYDEWFAPQRHLGSLIVAKYYKPKQYLVDMAYKELFSQKEEADANNNNDGSSTNSPIYCLGMHIRHSDKANRRRRIPVKKFEPYAQAYLEEIMEPSLSSLQRATIYLATDSHKVISKIQQDWSSDLISTMTWQQNIIRSNDTTPVFTLVDGSPSPKQKHYTGYGHHDTNVQVLVDILALSQCQFFIHGLSAVSEAVMYLNQDLHNNGNATSPNRRRVNLDTGQHPTVDEFRNSIRHWKKSLL